MTEILKKECEDFDDPMLKFNHLHRTSIIRVVVSLIYLLGIHREVNALLSK